MDDHSSTSNNPYLAPTAAIGDISGEIVLADRFTRWVALFFDGLILGVIGVPILLILAFFTIGLDMNAIQVFISTNTTLYVILVLILTIFVFLAVNFHPLRSNGQTVGKRIFNIKIVRSDGSPADVQRILLYRYLPVWLIRQIPIIGILFALIDALLIFRDSRKCLHDDIADTIVIKA